MSELEEEILKESVHAFINSIIHRATIRNVRKSPHYKSGLLSLIERILDLFTSNRQYKWQIDETYNIIPYFESHQRLILLLLTVSSILLIACSILTIIVGTAYVKLSESISTKPYTFQETGNSFKINFISLNFDFN